VIASVNASKITAQKFKMQKKQKKKQTKKKRTDILVPLLICFMFGMDLPAVLVYRLWGSKVYRYVEHS
jgi:hypothetical protein